MTEKRVLVAYGSKNGSTAEIAGWVRDVLREERLDARVAPAGEVREVASYDAVVIGGGLYAGRWQRDASRLARRERDTLARRPVWLFSSGPLDATATERDIPPVPGVRRIADAVHARGHTTFGGRLVEGARGFVARQIVKHGKGGDFRDRQQVREWAHAIATELTGVPQHH